MSNVIIAIASALGAAIESEKLATGAINAGHLIKESASGVAVHASAGASAQKLFALEDLATGGSADTAYATGDSVRFGAFHAGQEVYARLAAGASAVVVGDALDSDGDGTLRKQASSAATANTARNSVVGFALESVDNSGGGSEVFIKVRIA